MVTIVWDIDDVLNELTEEWIDSINHPSVFSKEQLKSPDFHSVLGWSQSEYLQSIDTFRLTSFVDLEPNASIQKFMSDNSHVVHLVLTATPLLSAHISAEWTFRNFGKWVDGFLLAPSSRPTISSTRRSKYDHLARLVSSRDVVLCIDDHPSNIAAALSAGAAPILWPQPWNGSSITHEDALLQLSKLLSEVTK
jgi:hypothetical protein